MFMTGWRQRSFYSTELTKDVLSPRTWARREEWVGVDMALLE